MNRRAKKIAALGLVLLAACQGCVSRSITIKSDPAGARAYLDGEYIGDTPVKVSFKHYGKRRVQLKKEGLQMLSKRITIKPPWHARFPIDFFTEVLLPIRFKDDQTFSFEFTEVERERDAFMERAKEGRKLLTEQKEPDEDGANIEEQGASWPERK